MQVVDERILCGKCGYRLKGLQDPGSCPDCGTLYNTSRNIGIKVFKSARARLSGTPLITAMVTGMISVIFLPCTGLAWVVHLNDPAHRGKPWGTTLFAIAFLGTFLVSIFMFVKEWWDHRQASRMPEE